MQKNKLPYDYSLMGLGVLRNVGGKLSKRHLGNKSKQNPEKVYQQSPQDKKEKADKIIYKGTQIIQGKSSATTTHYNPLKTLCKRCKKGWKGAAAEMKLQKHVWSHNKHVITGIARASRMKGVRHVVYTHFHDKKELPETRLGGILGIAWRTVN
ncbi:hypothetical protein JCM8097_008687 [Rhodosporidiobolus ruineniae]